MSKPHMTSIKCQYPTYTGAPPHEDQFTRTTNRILWNENNMSFCCEFTSHFCQIENTICWDFNNLVLLTMHVHVLLKHFKNMFEFNCFLAIKFKEIEVCFVNFDTVVYC